MRNKLFSILMCLVLSLSVFAGCGGSSDADYATKTVLQVGNYDGGIGHTWLEEAAKRFEEQFKDWVNPDDPSKVGVKIKIYNDKENISDALLINNIAYNEDVDMYYTSVLYDATAKSGEIIDITDVVKEKAYDEDGELASITGKTAVASILDTMDDTYKNAYNVSTTGTLQFYGLPYFYGVSGIWFDGDLFDARSLYFDKYGSIGVKSGDADISAGPDGEYGTYDDGQPATFEQFKQLLNGLNERGITPITFSAQNQYQRYSAEQAILANYLGATEAQKIWLDEGNFVNSVIDGEAEKAVITFAHLLGTNASKYISTNAFTSNSHTGAQEEFIYSTESTRPIAMFFEYSWWENEIRGGFDDMGSYDSSKAYGKRNFKYMCVPSFVGTPGVADKEIKNQVLLMHDEGFSVVISKYSKNKTLAKIFLQFEQQRSEMVAYAANTSCFRPYNYVNNMTNTEIASCTKLVQNVFKVMKQDNFGGVAISGRFSQKLRNNPANLRGIPVKAYMPASVQEPIKYFKDSNTKTVAEYINGVKAYYGDNW